MIQTNNSMVLLFWNGTTGIHNYCTHSYSLFIKWLFKLLGVWLNRRLAVLHVCVYKRSFYIRTRN